MRVYLSRHFRFNEHELPYKSILKSPDDSIQEPQINGQQRIVFKNWSDDNSNDIDIDCNNPVSRLSTCAHQT